MEKSKQAFFYEYGYYLFPATRTSLEELKKGGTVSVVRLKEEGCAAPEFLLGETETVALALRETDHIFGLRVDLYSREEYGGPPPRAELPPGVDMPAPFAVRCREFWRAQAAQEAELAAHCASGNTKKLNAAFSRIPLPFPGDVSVYGCLRDGRPALCLHAPPLRSALHTMFVNGLAAAADADMGAAGWQVLPCLSAGAAGDAAKKCPPFRLCPSREGRCLEILHPHAEKLTLKQKDAAASSVWLALCNAAGEDAVRSAAAGGIRFVRGAKRHGMSVEAAAALLGAAPRGDGVFPPFLSYAPAGRDALPFRERIASGVTRYEGMSDCGVGAAASSGAFWQSCGVLFAYLYVPRPAAGAERALDTLLWYLHHGKDPLAAEFLGAAEGQDRFFLDFLVTDTPFFRKLRAMAPVLHAFGARLVVLTGEGPLVFRCGFDLFPEGSILHQ